MILNGYLKLNKDMLNINKFSSGKFQFIYVLLVEF